MGNETYNGIDTGTPAAEQLAGSLKRSPVFNLSLGSKELFHSNFLAWLCETYPQELGVLFAQFIGKALGSGVALKGVYRERNNIDLTLEYSNGQFLVVENKVKSLPNKSQLQAYAEAVDRTWTDFLLLSLVEPVFLDPSRRQVTLLDGTFWHYIGYRDLAIGLERIVVPVYTFDPYHGQILRDYVEVAMALDTLQSLYAIRRGYNEQFFYLTAQDTATLQQIRFHDVIEKLRYAQLAAAVAAELERRGFDVIHDGWEKRTVARVFVSSGMTRGTGLFDLRYVIGRGIRGQEPPVVGVQVQGRSFRLISDYSNSKKSRQIAEALFQPAEGQSRWFRFSLGPDSRKEHPSNKDFNQYSGTFFYRSREVAPDMRTGALIDLIVAYAERLREDERDITETISEVLRMKE